MASDAQPDSPAIPDPQRQWSDLISKKLLAGPTMAVPLLATHQITGWQFAAIIVAYLLVQGAVDSITALLKR